jgi:uncharacterized repeat protein (TIGR03847 family)
MSDSFEFDAPDHFTTGTVGPVGQRVFYLQAGQGSKLVTLKCEKEQVKALGEYLGRLLGSLSQAAVGETGADVALIEPVSEAWAVGSLGVGYDEPRDRIVIVASEAVEEESGEEAATARIHITREQAATFVERARELVEAGRPACPVCSLPIDPAGHICPRANGHFVHERADPT